MSQHSADYENSAADHCEYFGQPISYTDKSLVAPVDVALVTVHREKSERRNTSQGWVFIRTRKIYLDTDDLAVKTDGIFTIDGVQYSVESIGTRTGNQTLVNLKRTNAGEVSRPGARR